MAEVVSGVGPGVEACEMASCQADGACVVSGVMGADVTADGAAPRAEGWDPLSAGHRLTELACGPAAAPRKRRSARNVIARRVLAQFDAGGQPVTFDNLAWALEFADVALDALYDAGLRVTPYLCRTCE